MGSKLVVFVCFGIVAMVGVPYYISKEMQLGSFAKSPQKVELTLGASVPVAGGRAKIWFAGGSSGGDYEVSCKKESRYFDPFATEDEVCRVCGITVKLDEVEDGGGRPPRAKFTVTW